MLFDLPEPRRMLDQVISTRSMRLGVADQPPHGVELVIARENHRFLADRPQARGRFDRPLRDFKVHEALKNIEQAVGAQHLVP